ncbi:DUF5916 domain-containing protein [Fimbriimonas ginsengisoli]|uniref:DUF5916 domain-containing protein n=1 Tax=Fimbriimonas ginsengisoli TaxID=1005039 RepID=UPI00118479E9|nr:DUF5916 domain-containing protein [Fimbriimonas ginsengisoli]
MLFAFVTLASAQAPVIVAAKITVPPKIDGTVDDTEWHDAAMFEGLVDETTGQTSPEAGKFWIAYDEKYIYFAARLMDSQPGSIQATEYRTNVGMNGDDNVVLDIDLSGSLSDFNTFQTNPRGATNVRLSGGRAAKREWNGEMVAQSRRTPGGWETEMRIPWSALPIPKAGKRDVRINVERFIPRLNRTFSNVFINDGKSANTPIWRDVILPKPYVDRSIKLLPYAYAGLDGDRGTILNGGMDLKTSLNENVNLVGTINPDFRNIERSVLSLDFSRFARIANENRPFFQEGSSYYNSQLFFPQTIRQFDVGVNAYGKLNDKTQFGFLDTIDFGKENVSVGNLTYAPTANDNYRVTATSRTRPGYENSAYLARYSKTIGPWNIFVRDMGSRDTTLHSGEQTDLALGYFKGGFFSNAGYTRATENFFPGVGFVPETDYKGMNYFLGYQHPLDKGPLQSYAVNLTYLNYDHISGKRYRDDANGDFAVTTRSGLALDYNVDRATFEGSHDRIDTATVSFPVSDPYRNVQTSYASGEIGGDKYRLLTVGSSYRLFGKLQLTGTYQKFHLGAVDTDQTIFSSFYDLGHDRSVSGRLVRTGSDTNWYLAFRRSGNRGAEYYLIFGDPSALRFRTSVILKVVVPFRV